MTQETICPRHKQLISFVCAHQNCPSSKLCEQCKYKQNLHFTQHANYIYRLKDFYQYSISKQLVPKLQKGVLDSQNFISNHKSFYNEQKRILSSDFDILAESFKQVSQTYHQIYQQAFQKQMNMFDQELMTIKKLLKDYLYQKNQNQSFFSKLFGNQSQDNHSIDNIIKKNAKVFKIRASIINLRSKIAMAKTNKTAYKASNNDQSRFQELKIHFKQVVVTFYDKLKELLSNEGNNTSMRSSIVSQAKSLSNSQVSNNSSLNGSQISITSQPLAYSHLSSASSKSLLSQKQNPNVLHQSRVRVSLPEPHPSVKKIMLLLKPIQYPLNLPILPFIANKKQEGPYKYPLGTYYGTYLDGIRYGKGIFVFHKDGSYYQGTWQKDNMWGYGRLITQNSYYEGQIANGAANGQGTFQNSHKVYSGEWKCDLRHGRGQQVYKKKRYRYKGHFVTDKYHGYGVLQEQDITYTGQFKEGVYDGQGTIRYKTGETFSGIFRNGQKVSGKHHIPDGSYYEGQYQKGVPHGKGQFKWPDGLRYIGFWKEGLQDGEGSEIFDGRQQKGIWKNGNFLHWR